MTETAENLRALIAAAKRHALRVTLERDAARAQADAIAYCAKALIAHMQEFDSMTGASEIVKALEQAINPEEHNDGHNKPDRIQT